MPGANDVHATSCADAAEEMTSAVEANTHAGHDNRLNGLLPDCAYADPATAASHRLPYAGGKKYKEGLR